MHAATVGATSAGVTAARVTAAHVTGAVPTSAGAAGRAAMKPGSRAHRVPLNHRHALHWSPARRPAGRECTSHARAAVQRGRPAVRAREGPGAASEAASTEATDASSSDTHAAQPPAAVGVERIAERRPRAARALVRGCDGGRRRPVARR